MLPILAGDLDFPVRLVVAITSSIPLEIAQGPPNYPNLILPGHKVEIAGEVYLEFGPRRATHWRIQEEIRQIFGAVAMAFANYSDPEEGWSKGVLTVDTKIDDFASRAALEDRFYEIVASEEPLQMALHSLTVVFS